MKWINHLNKAINYIEAHLTDEIDLEKLAQLACCSTFHFQRIFSYIAEIPLSEYIRRRKCRVQPLIYKIVRKKLVILL